jgi:uncharacterized protein (UPF0332 family)
LARAARGDEKPYSDYDILIVVERRDQPLVDALYEAVQYDDVVSRAYYSAYHAAQALLKTEGLEADSHQGVAHLFGLHFAKTGKVPRKLGRYPTNPKDDRESRL